MLLLETKARLLESNSARDSLHHLLQLAQEREAEQQIQEQHLTRQIEAQRQEAIAVAARTSPSNSPSPPWLAPVPVELAFSMTIPPESPSKTTIPKVQDALDTNLPSSVIVPNSLETRATSTEDSAGDSGDQSSTPTPNDAAFFPTQQSSSLACSPTDSLPATNTGRTITSDTVTKTPFQMRPTDKATGREHSSARHCHKRLVAILLSLSLLLATVVLHGMHPDLFVLNGWCSPVMPGLSVSSKNSVRTTGDEKETTSYEAPWWAGDTAWWKVPAFRAVCGRRRRRVRLDWNNNNIGHVLLTQLDDDDHHHVPHHSLPTAVQQDQPRDFSFLSSLHILVPGHFYRRQQKQNQQSKKMEEDIGKREGYLLGGRTSSGVSVVEARADAIFVYGDANELLETVVGPWAL